MIPKSVTREQYVEAIRPLLELLGTKPENVYSQPGIFISSAGCTGETVHTISFVHVPGHLVEEDPFKPGVRPKGMRVPGDRWRIQEGDDAAELVQPVTVAVVEPAYAKAEESTEQ